MSASGPQRVVASLRRGLPVEFVAVSLAVIGGIVVGVSEARFLGSKTLLLALACAAMVAVTASRWRNALPFLPLALLPLPAMTLTRLGPVSLPWFFAVAIGAAAVWVVVTARVKFRADVIAIAVLTLTAAMLILVPLTGGAGSTSTAVQVAIVWGVGLALGSAFGATDAHAILLAQVASPLAVLAIVEQFAFRFTYSRAIGATNYLSLGTSGGDVRAISTFGHPLVAGACLVTLGVLILSTSYERRWAIAGLLLGGGLATVSRSAIVGGIAGVLVLLAMSGPTVRRHMIRGAVVLLVILAGVIAVSSQARRTFDGRILDASASQEQIRSNSLTVASEDLDHHFGTLLFGGGLGTATKRIEALGGNLGFPVFDNQYVTSLYDLGIVPTLLLVAGLGWAIARAPSGGRQRGLPALITLGVTFAFFDGLGWPVTNFLLWYLVGTITSGSAAKREMPYAYPAIT